MRIIIKTNENRTINVGGTDYHVRSSSASGGRTVVEVRRANDGYSIYRGVYTKSRSYGMAITSSKQEVLNEVQQVLKRFNN